MIATVTATLRALGTTATVIVDDAGAIVSARRALEDELARIDAACSRFRADSELSRVNRAPGRPVTVGPLLLEALDVALDVAGATGGAVVPTVGRAIRALGYDRDFSPALRAPRPVPARPVPGAESVELDRAASTVTVQEGTELDLGATAKALAADRAARAAHAATGVAVLVNLGGDVATAGRPRHGAWRIRIADDHAAADGAPGQTVAVADGGLATSSTTVRRWDGVHHIVDPATGRSCRVVWRTVSAAAATCVGANAASTAGIVWGERAPERLRELEVPARLVAADGRVVRVNGWPADEDQQR